MGVLQEIKSRDSQQLAVSDEDGRFLRFLTASTEAKRVLEIGGASGYSAIWIGLGLRATGGRLVTIEYDAERAKELAANVTRAGLMLAPEIDARGWHPSSSHFPSQRAQAGQSGPEPPPPALLAPPPRPHCPVPPCPEPPCPEPPCPVPPSERPLKSGMHPPDPSKAMTTRRRATRCIGPSQAPF